jgi:hypothetical protein
LTPYFVTIRLGGMLGIGWRDLVDIFVVRAALEDAAGGGQGPLDELIRSGRVVELPDGEPAMVMQATGKLARIRFWPDSGTVVDAWAARPIVEPDDQPDDGPVMGAPHRGTTSRPKPPRH